MSDAPPNEPSARFVTLVVGDRLDSDVIYVESNQNVLIGEYLDVPGGYRYKILDNTHDGAIVVELEPRKGAGPMLERLFGALLSFGGPAVPAGGILRVEENHDDPQLAAYYELLRRAKGMERDEHGVYDKAGSIVPPQIAPSLPPPGSRAKTRHKRLVLTVRAAIGGTILGVALLAIIAKSGGSESGEKPAAVKPKGGKKGAPPKSDTPVEGAEGKSDLALKILGEKDDPTRILISSARDMAVRWSFAPAEAMLREAVRKRSGALGGSHPKVVECLEPLADVLDRQRKFKEAVEIRERILEARRKSSGGDDRTTALCLRSLAESLRGAKDLDSARKRATEAVELARKFLSSEPAELAATIEIAGLVAAEQGAKDEALRLAAQALALRKSAFAEESVEVADGLRASGRIADAAGDHRQAEESLGQALVMRTKLLGEHEFITTEIMFELAGALHRAGEAALAADIYKEAVAARKAFHETATPGVMPEFPSSIESYSGPILPSASAKATPAPALSGTAPAKAGTKPGGKKPKRPQAH